MRRRAAPRCRPRAADPGQKASSPRARRQDRSDADISFSFRSEGDAQADGKASRLCGRNETGIGIAQLFCVAKNAESVVTPVKQVFDPPENFGGAYSIAG